MDNQNFFLVGMNHMSVRDDEFQKKLILAASNGKIGLGLEGFVFSDKEVLDDVITSAYGIKNTKLIFGLEDDFVKKFSGVLLDYGYFKADMKEQIYIVKLQLIMDIMVSNSFKKAWDYISSNPNNFSTEVNSLVSSINSFIAENKNLGLKKLVNMFQSKLDQLPFSNNHSYVELFKEIIIYMEKNADPKYNIGSFENKINAYLKDPKKNADFIVYEINGEWRDHFIVENMKEIIDNISKFDLPVYFLIGSGHIESLSEKIGSSYGRYIKRVYYKTELVPSCFIP